MKATKNSIPMSLYTCTIIIYSLTIFAERILGLESETANGLEIPKSSQLGKSVCVQTHCQHDNLPESPLALGTAMGDLEIISTHLWQDSP